MRILKTTIFTLLSCLISTVIIHAQDCSNPSQLCFVQFDNVTMDSTQTGPLTANLNCGNPASNGTLFQVTTVAPGDLLVSIYNASCDTSSTLGEELIVAIYNSPDPCNPAPGDLIVCNTVMDDLEIPLVADSAGQNFYVAIYGQMGNSDLGPAACGYELQTSGPAVEFTLTVPSVQFEILLGESVEMEGVGGVESYLWEGMGQISDDTIANPVIQPNGIGEFLFSVTGTQGDCEVVETVTIIVQPNIIPADVITPNGDGINDEWYILFLDERFERADVRVFDRWGQQVFKSIGYSLNQLWDGTNKGNVLPAGAYYYVIDLKTGDTGEGPIFTGAISLIY